MNIQWNSDLETGNHMIDGEHKKLIAYINDLMDACGKGQGRAKVEESANFLLSYTKSHFSHEETLQMQKKYPQYDAHKKWHTEFMQKAGALVEQVKKDGPSIASVAQINSQAGVLLTHIKSMDMALAKFLKENK